MRAVHRDFAGSPVRDEELREDTNPSARAVDELAVTVDADTDRIDGRDDGIVADQVDPDRTPLRHAIDVFQATARRIERATIARGLQDAESDALAASTWASELHQRMAAAEELLAVAAEEVEHCKRDRLAREAVESKRLRWRFVRNVGKGLGLGSVAAALAFVVAALVDYGDARSDERHASASAAASAAAAVAADAAHDNQIRTIQFQLIKLGVDPDVFDPLFTARPR